MPYPRSFLCACAHAPSAHSLALLVLPCWLYPAPHGLPASTALLAVSSTARHHSSARAPSLFSLLNVCSPGSSLKGRLLSYRLTFSSRTCSFPHLVGHSPFRRLALSLHPLFEGPTVRTFHYSTFNPCSTTTAEPRLLDQGFTANPFMVANPPSSSNERQQQQR